MAVARSSSVGVAIRCVLPVFHVLAVWRVTCTFQAAKKHDKPNSRDSNQILLRNKASKYRLLIVSYIPQAKSVVYDCLDTDVVNMLVLVTLSSCYAVRAITTTRTLCYIL